VNFLTRQEAGLAGELLGSRAAQASEIGLDRPPVGVVGHRVRNVAIGHSVDHAHD
jgi:hypothetical protein